MLGLVIATQLGWHDLPSIALAIVLAFVFGYSLTLRPLLASGVRSPQRPGLRSLRTRCRSRSWRSSTNAIVVAIPGAMAAGVIDPLFWGSLALSLAVAGVAAFPVNRWLIQRGQGHAVLHGRH